MSEFNIDEAKSEAVAHFQPLPPDLIEPRALGFFHGARWKHNQLNAEIEKLKLEHYCQTQMITDESLRAGLLSAEVKELRELVRCAVKKFEKQQKTSSLTIMTRADYERAKKLSGDVK